MIAAGNADVVDVEPRGTSERVLIVEDDAAARVGLEQLVRSWGFIAESACDGEEALKKVTSFRPAIVITDMVMPRMDGLALLRALPQVGADVTTLLLTAQGTVETAVEAMREGAYDYLTKPVDLKQFRGVVASALGRGGSGAPTVDPTTLPSEHRPAATPRTPRVAPPPTPVPVSAALGRMAGQSMAMQQVRSLVEKVARSMAPVLVAGESGTGKELVARAIHEVSVRSAMPFVPVNCSAIPENLLEAEFFGYRKGAFTGANDDREGFFQAANGGTLFLDEIGDLPLSMQSKLLRAIQERSVRPVGAVTEVPVDVRLLSATHKDLGAEVQSGQFRQDLYYRLNVIQIRVPPLRERLEDLMGISERVLERLARDAGVWPAPRLTRDAVVHLSRYPFPGNVRELENLLHRAVALSGAEEVDVYDLGLPESVFTDSAAQELDQIGAAAESAAEPARHPARMAPVEEPLPNDLARYLDDVERDILVRALEHHRFNRTAAGISLGLSLRQMRYRMARLNVNVGGDSGGVDRE
jgi:two-component system, NtrC family, response regulator PilR